MKKILFKGVAKPSVYWVGQENQKKEFKDKFGELKKGEIRYGYLNTKWGQLGVPYKWMGKRLIIEVKDFVSKKQEVKE